MANLRTKSREISNSNVFIWEHENENIILKIMFIFTNPIVLILAVCGSSISSAHKCHCMTKTYLLSFYIDREYHVIRDIELIYYVISDPVHGKMHTD